MTSQQVAEHQARVAKAVPQECASAASGGRESKLHDEIIAHCKKMGWYFVHSRMDKRSTNAVGTPDFIIAAKGGMTFWIEAKAKGGKPTPPQRDANYWLNMLGHRAAIVWTFEEFLTAIA